MSAQDAIEEGDIETLREDILEAFSEEQVEEIERRLDNGDFFEFLTDLLDEWSGDDADELLELIDTQLGDVGVDVKFEKRGAAAEAEGEEEEDDATDFEEEDLEEDEDLDDEDEDRRRRRRGRRGRGVARRRPDATGWRMPPRTPDGRRPLSDARAGAAPFRRLVLLRSRAVPGRGVSREKHARCFVVREGGGGAWDSARRAMALCGDRVRCARRPRVSPPSGSEAGAAA